MFSGIVETTGTVKNIITLGNFKKITCNVSPPFLEECCIGDSININGVCLTAIRFSKTSFSAEIIEETLKKTNLGLLQEKSQINLSRAMKVSDRLGGHFVQGHVDCVVEIIFLKKEPTSWKMGLSMPKEIARHIVPKGFITLDGMSLTIVDAEETFFTVALIPHTIEQTITKDYRVGQLLNLETDMMAKHIDRLLQLQGGYHG